jgi:AraC-like DNA-binding protein
MLSAGMRIYHGGLSRATPGWSGRKELEERLKIWVPVSGAAAHAVGEQWMEMRPGQLYFIPGGRAQAWRCERGLEVYWFHARPESLALDHRLSRAPIRAWPRRRWQHWKPVWEGLPEFFRTRDEAFALRIQAMAAEIVAEVLADLPPESRQRPRDRIERFAPALALIDEGFVNGLPIATLAGATRMSVVHFHREFTRLFHATPHAYMQRRRIELAQQLLRASDEPIAAIAARCGYDDAFYFARVFRREVGRSPSAFRSTPDAAGP